MKSTNHKGNHYRLWVNENDEIHREDGPAIEWNDGSKNWFLNHKEYTKELYKEEMYKRNLKKLNESY